MADVCVDSLHAETTLNGNYQDNFEEGKSEVVRGTVKGFTKMTEENGHDGDETEEPNEKESHSDEENAEADDAKQEEPEAVKTSEQLNEKVAKRRGRGRATKVISEAKQGNSEEKPEKKDSEGKKREKKEPATPIIDRPARERKSIDRFSASAEKEKVRELKIEKGGGTLLKDIPNVVFRLSRKTGSDDSVQLLHKLLYGKRVKPFHAKLNIFQFSGYVWGPNQEKEKAKAKERLEKCNKENLFQVAELLDLIFSKAEKKEDIVAKVLEFLESPHKTRDKLLEDNQKGKGKKPKGKKRKNESQRGSGKGSSGQTPRKRRKSGSTPSKGEDAGESMDVEDENEDEDDKGDEWAEEEEEELEEEEPVKTKQGRKGVSDDEDFEVKPKKSKKGRKPAKKAAGVKTDTKEASDEAEESEEEKINSPKKVSVKSPAKSGKASVQSPGKGATKSETASSKVFSRKKKKEDDQEEVVKEIVKETPSKEKQRKARAASKASAKDKEKTRQKTKGVDPSDEELRTAISDLLKEADFSTVTFTDVVKQLEKQFKMDLSQKKGHVKVLIREEINKIAEEDEGEGDAEEEVEGDNEESDPEALADQAVED